MLGPRREDLRMVLVGLLIVPNNSVVGDVIGADRQQPSPIINVVFTVVAQEQPARSPQSLESGPPEGFVEHYDDALPIAVDVSSFARLEDVGQTH